VRQAFLFIGVNMDKPGKAYKNLEFLNSSDARTIRILSEFYEPQSRFRKNKIVDTIVFFGSARIRSKSEIQKEINELKTNKPKNEKVFQNKLEALQTKLIMSRYYDDAVELSKRLTEWSMKLPTNGHRFTICSGGGPGIMEAANKGAKVVGGKSIGLNISIPFEQFVNKFVTPELAFEFHYFFMRKFWFAYLAKVLVVFPGGFGTLDELMEMITLLQTGKIKKNLKVVIYDSMYWNDIIDFDKLVKYGMISKKDLQLFDFCDTIDQAFERITTHFEKNYLNDK